MTYSTTDLARAEYLSLVVESGLTRKSGTVDKTVEAKPGFLERVRASLCMQRFLPVCVSR